MESGRLELSIVNPHLKDPTMMDRLFTLIIFACVVAFVAAAILLF